MFHWLRGRCYGEATPQHSIETLRQCAGRQGRKGGGKGFQGGWRSRAGDRGGEPNAVANHAVCVCRRFRRFKAPAAGNSPHGTPQPGLGETLFPGGSPLLPSASLLFSKKGAGRPRFKDRRKPMTAVKMHQSKVMLGLIKKNPWVHCIQMGQAPPTHEGRPLPK